jgi:phenylalanyl-tRNA synthetase beta chain
MLVSLQWLRELVELPQDPEVTARRLTMAGVEVEGVHRPGATSRGILAAEVVSAEPIQGKSLLLCKVFDGAQERTVVCGDTTVKAGERVAYGPPGSAAGGKDLGVRAFAGTQSEGMLCSLADLALEEKSDAVLRLSAAPGTPLAEIISLDDVVWELNVTPNRADALSHWGVARELAAVLGVKAKGVKARAPEKGGEFTAEVENRDPRGCPLYTARVIRGVKVGPSPLAVRLRLERCGMRSINNVVDATNLALLELGQPLHAFDLGKLAGGKIVVRRASAGEPLVLLDGKERLLTVDDLVIADAERPVALAGVMGGANSEVSAATVDLLLESAYFDPVAVRKSSKRHGLHTEASHRFERAVDPAAVETALDRCAQLIVELAGGKIDKGVRREGPGVPAPEAIRLRPARIRQILGIDVTAVESKELLKRLGCKISSEGKETVVVPPTWRGDLTQEIDLIEEIVRLYGYDRVPAAAPVAQLDAAPAPIWDRRQTARVWMEDAGFNETVTYSFISPEWWQTLQLAGRRAERVPVGNPLTVEQSVMRTSLLPSLLEAAAGNIRRGNLALRLFDLSRVFFAGDPPAEPEHLGGVVFGPWDDSVWAGQGRGADFYDLKGVIEGLVRRLGAQARFEPAAEPFLHPGVAARVLVNGREAGWAGALHPAVLRKLDLPAGLAFELAFDALTPPARAAVQAPSRFPGVSRDVAFLVDAAVTVGAVEDALQSAAPAVLESIALFDVYAGESLGGRKNLAYHLRFQAPDRTLVDTEVDTAVAAMVKAVETRCGGELRAR